MNLLLKFADSNVKRNEEPRKRPNVCPIVWEVDVHWGFVIANKVIAKPSIQISSVAVKNIMTKKSTVRNITLFLTINDWI